MSNNPPSLYGYDNHPPFSLYQDDDGKWGLIDADGVRLPAVFNRSADGEVFSRVPWETVTFDVNEGFELLAWYDPDEVWFNFTFNNLSYPEKWGNLLWKKEKGTIDDYFTIYLDNLPEKDRWLIHILSDFFHKIKEIEKQGVIDDEPMMRETMQDFLCRHPQLYLFAELNNMLAPVLDNPDIPEDTKVVLWCGKVCLDYELRYYFEIDTKDE